MRCFVSESAESYTVGDLDVARWEQYSLEGTLPFQAMWYTVPPGSSSPRDCHPEIELSIVISGQASVEASGRITDVGVGSAFLLDSEEAHVIHNRSAQVPLLVFASFWMPSENAAGTEPAGAAEPLEAAQASEDGAP
jgi:mannose-6-phosphate isomerase-like protein (cupin superfamily)